MPRCMLEQSSIFTNLLHKGAYSLILYQRLQRSLITNVRTRQDKFVNILLKAEMKPETRFVSLLLISLLIGIHLFAYEMANSADPYKN